MQESTCKILGIPGVALFERTNFPDLSKVVFFSPSILICSFMSKRNGDDVFVASEIFNHLKPVSERYSCIGLGDPPLLTTTKSPNTPSPQSSPASALVNKTEKFCIGQNTTLIISKEIDPKFSFYYLISSDAKHQIDGLVGGRTNTSKNNISNLGIIIFTKGLKNILINC
jgi:hypothetical protein